MSKNEKRLASENDIARAIRVLECMLAMPVMDCPDEPEDCLFSERGIEDTMSKNEMRLVPQSDVDRAVWRLDLILDMPVPDDSDDISDLSVFRFHDLYVRRAEFSTRLDVLLDLGLISCAEFKAYCERFAERYKIAP